MTRTSAEILRKFEQFFSSVSDDDILRYDSGTGLWASSNVLTLLETALDTKILDGLQTWTPSGYVGNASMTWSSVTSNNAVYARIANMCFVAGRFSGETKGTASYQLGIEGLPYTVLANSNHAITCRIYDGSVWRGGMGGIAGTTIYGSKYDNSNFGIGSNRRIYLATIYPTNQA